VRLMVCGGLFMRYFIRLAAAALAGVFVLAACNSKESVPKIAKAPSPSATAQVSDNVRRITPAELKEEMARNDVVIVDVRGEAAYKAGHIKGSRLIPSTDILAHVDELPRDKMIVTYCS